MSYDDTDEIEEAKREARQREEKHLAETKRLNELVEAEKLKVEKWE